ncbi:Holliday junction resolvase RuvX [bacterium]|nr:Holliday junction resolvase RuvX [bacterium]
MSLKGKRPRGKKGDDAPVPERKPEEPAPTTGLVLGVDYGTVRIGLAVGDLVSGLVLPVPILEHPGSQGNVVSRLAEIARAKDAVAIVIGNPLHLSGKPGTLTAEVTAVRDALAKRLSLPVHLRDESLTSVGAEESLSSAGLKWWQYPKDKIDTIAAMTIVREFLMEQNPALGKLDDATPFEATPREREKDSRRKRRKREREDEDDDSPDSD